MGTSQMLGEDIDSWETMMFLYNSALKEVGTKLEILNDEFVHIHKYNPIEYIKSRIKTPESIVKKLKRDGYESTIENMRNYINDIAGIRIVCSFTSDIYRLAEMIGKQNDLTVICVKDYIKNPKVSGYKSFHMHVTVPIFLSDRVVETKVEIQIRTIAMDFWASLEHKIYYKFEGHAPEYISRDLRACAEIVSNLDAKMLQLNEAILEEKEKEEQKKKEKRQENALMGGTVAISIVLAVAIFMVLPYYISVFFQRFITSQTLLALLEGVIRLTIFIGYVAAISLMPDIKRVYMYHGAEHKCINCIEQGMDLTVENVRKSSRLHKRCGTSFLLIVMLISIVFFLFIRVDNRILQLLLRLVLIPVIAGVSYEFIRLAGRSDHMLVNLFSKPGLLLQRITTREPDDSMIEVGIASVEAVFDWKAYVKEIREQA